MSKLFCDTNSEIALDFYKSHDMGLIKMPYTVDGQEAYYDLGENTDLKSFFEKMRKGAVVKTQALNEFDYIDYFEPVLGAGQDVLYITFSHKLSGTFLALDKAIETLKAKYPSQKISVVDTMNISIGAGALVMLAAKAHKEGKSDEEIISFIENMRNKIKTFFTVESLEYLKRGGRLSKFKTFVGTMFNVKPIITVKDGALINSETVKGRKAALRRLSAIIKEGNVDVSHPVMLLHADCKEDVLQFKEMLLEVVGDTDIYIQDVGPVIGCHCGPGTIGMIFACKE